MSAFNFTEQPMIQGVYEVYITIHGAPPRSNDPKLYAYHDGLDEWGPWEFSVDRALRSSGGRMSNLRNYPWREVEAS